MMIILKEEMIIVFLKNFHNLVSLFYHFLFYLVNFGRRALVSNENKYEFRMGQVTPSPSKYGISSKFSLIDSEPRYNRQAEDQTFIDGKPAYKTF